METRTVMRREMEEQSTQMSHSMQLSSQIKKKTFKSSDEEGPYSYFHPIIPADVMSVKEILNMDSCRRTWEMLSEPLAAGHEYYREKRTLFGNETQKVELDVLRNQRLLRQRVDRRTLRQQAEKKASAHMKYLERLRQKPPDFTVPLRAHTVWQHMKVVLTCVVQGYPPPKVTWYKNGVPLRRSEQPWNYSLQQEFGLNALEIRRCCPDDAGEYKVIARSPLGEAMSFGILVVNSYQGALAGSVHWHTPGLNLEEEAHFLNTFPPTWVTEGNDLTLQCCFAPALPQEVSWFRDGIQLYPSSTVAITTVDHMTSITLRAVHKEHEGFYTVRLKTWNEVEHTAYIYVKDASATVLGAPASPLAVQVSDVNKDYVFLTWQPPSADGASPVDGYYVEKYDVSQGEWVRCNMHIQKMCHYPVFGLKEGSLYQFRVCAVNKAGVGRPSKASEPVRTADPLEHTRTAVVKADRGRTVTITKDELEGQVKVPFPPTNVHACEVSDTYVVLSWTEPEPRGREPLTFYVERSLVGSNSWELASLDLVVSSPRFPVFDLVKGKQYHFRVRSVNKHGVSDPSKPSEPISLGKQQAIPAPPHSVLAIRDTDTSVLLQWKEPKDKTGVLGYYLYYCEVGKQDWNTVNNKPVTSTRFTVHGLETRKTYIFRVKSVSHAGNSDYSKESEAILVKAALRVPSPPSAIALLLCTGTEMVLGWRAPARNGGDPVRGYYLDQREFGLTAWREVNVKATKERKFKVCNLINGSYYQFRVFAANLVGVGKPSDASEAFLCEKWTMPEPGCPYDAQVREVRDDSLVLLWEAPLYEGSGPVTGYLVEISEGEQSDSWMAVNETPVCDTHYKVSDLQAGQTYRLRVLAVNEAGVGCPSLPTEPVTAQTPPGTRSIEIGVDDDGFIFLGYDADMDAEAEFIWRKNYTEPIDSSRAHEGTKTDGVSVKSVLTFTDASEEDLGLYTVEKSDEPELSSSYDFTAEDLERLKELSWEIRNPLINLKSGWQVEVSEEGNVRLWLQTESLSDSAELRLIFNDREISSSPHRQIKFNKAEGLVEILFDQLSPEDEGSYTAQLQDGRAKNQFTLVFVDDNFRRTLALAHAKRRDHQRKSGPYFLEFLSWSVNEECELIIKCKVTNTNKDTSLTWFKEDGLLSQAVYDQSSGLSTLTIQQVTKKTAGSYRAVVSDKRGEDVSTLNLLGDEYDKFLQQLSQRCAMSAGPLMIESTAEGFKLYCSLKYYVNQLKTSWLFRDKKIEPSSRMRTGSSVQRVWLEIQNPTESDKGKYTLVMFDGTETHERSLDLSGQVFADALLEHQRLKQLAITEKNRAKVLKGIPDAVAIMEGKSLCLTCFIDGTPDPEIIWLKNDKEILDQGQFTISREHKGSTITINNVMVGNSGKYSVFVRNEYGSEKVDVTVSVYKCGETPPENAVEMG
ncbi:myomesin-3 [Takifugu rubripes]|uniref:Myomesin 3 n=1 Tax=Takifugu rubripes TaxID=31033 RepID=H2T4S2_TAKRU|nr:myomesin-3-like [Takifugu rubripes]